MTDRAVLVRKLANLGDHLGRIRRRRGDDYAALAVDQDRQDALALSILVALQEVFDIAFHISTTERLGLPGSNAEAVELLGQHGVLTPDLARRVARGGHTRNLIAHGCASVSLRQLFDDLEEGIPDLLSFQRTIASWLQEPEER